MTRHVISLLFLCSTLKATPFVFTTCSAGTTTLTDGPMCSLNFSNYEVIAQTWVVEGGQLVEGSQPFFGLGLLPDLPGGTGQSVLAHVETQSSLAAPALSGEALANDVVSYNSAGPPRSGFIEFGVLFDYFGQDQVPGARSLTITVGGQQFNLLDDIVPTNCNPEDCVYIGTVPFALGTQFQVSVAGHAALSLSAAFDRGRGIDGGVQFSFRLLEADGTTVVPLTVVPEPASVPMLLLAAAIGANFARKYRRSRQH